MIGALKVAATEASLAGIRTWLDQTVGACVADTGIQARLVLAVHEVAANVIEHAYAGAAIVEVAAELADRSRVDGFVADGEDGEGTAVFDC